MVGSVLSHVEDGSIIPFAETPFYKKQRRIALRNCGVIEAENIEEAIGAGDYQALAKVLTSMTPDDVLNEINESGLRGRGEEAGRKRPSD